MLDDDDRYDISNINICSSCPMCLSIDTTTDEELELIYEKETEDPADDEPTEEDIFDFLPIHRQHEILGVDYIINRNSLMPDPLLMPLYEHIAKNILTPTADFARQKLNYSFIGGANFDA